MLKVLVTGGAGFIGANFVRHLLHTDPSLEIVNLDSLTYAGSTKSLNGLDSARHRMIKGSICDRPLLDHLLRQHAIDTVVHFAAETHVDRSITQPSAFVDTNLVGTFTLLEASREYWLGRRYVRVDAARFHHVSTDEVYGSLGSGDAPATEAQRYDPSSPYSATKAGADHLVRAYGHTYGLPITISNCSNNFGPYQFPEKLVPLLILNALHGRPLPIYGDGQHQREWLYVEDHCRGIEQILRHGRVGETYNIGAKSSWRNLDLCRLLCQLIDELFATDNGLAERYPSAVAAHGNATASTITFVADRPGHDRRYAIDSNKIRRELGFFPMETFETGISKTLRWYLDHADWWGTLSRDDSRGGIPCPTQS